MLQFRTSFGELRDLSVKNCVPHHEMDVEWFGRELSQGSNEIGEEKQRRGEMAIRHVDVKDVGERLDAAQIGFEIREVGGTQRDFGHEAV